ncbi:hypothetical protein ON010_g16282 [Phytophthora cinnamomi]|nr:hypothetical protein ON010_g16282 [Phytophthora cinnamomi]
MLHCMGALDATGKSDKSLWGRTLARGFRDTNSWCRPGPEAGEADLESVARGVPVVRPYDLKKKRQEERVEESEEEEGGDNIVCIDGAEHDEDKPSQAKKPKESKARAAYGLIRDT